MTDSDTPVLYAVVQNEKWEHGWAASIWPTRELAEADITGRHGVWIVKTYTYNETLGGWLHD